MLAIGAGESGHVASNPGDQIATSWMWKEIWEWMVGNRSIGRDGQLLTVCAARMEMSRSLFADFQQTVDYRFGVGGTSSMLMKAVPSLL